MPTCQPLPSIPAARPPWFPGIRTTALLVGMVLPAAALAADPEATVDVPGYGPVPLADARATCTNGSGIGALAEPGSSPRTAALIHWGEGQLGTEHEGWPHEASDLTYNDVEVTWVPRGVVTSCWAVGRHDVAVGRGLRSTCSSDRSACRDAFTEAERVVVKDAIRGKVKERRDGMFETLAQLPDLATWTSPLSALGTACSWPNQASQAGRFIDTDDLAAARSACVQLLELLTGDASADLAALPCAGTWASVPSDVLPTPDTDLGALSAVEVASSAEIRRTTVHDKLTRMNPLPGGCEAEGPLARIHGATWSDALVAVYQEAQQVKACEDDALPLGERLELCPNLVERAEASCRRGEHDACDLLARLHLEGIGVEADEVAAFEVWQTSCNASHSPACEAILQRSDRVEAWFTEALDVPVGDDVPPPEAVPTASPLQEASELLARFGTALGPEWVQTQAKKLFEVAIAARDAKVASDVLTMYGTTMGEDWKAAARTEVDKLKQALAKQKP